PMVVAIDVDTGEVETLSDVAQLNDVPQGSDGVSRATHQAFLTQGGEVGHAWLYRPANAHWSGPHDALPPLIVTSHGGPTGASRRAFDLGVQFWTSRGFALLDVDYRGSSGYGRTYRRLLDGPWAVADVEDCIASALHLADLGLVDRQRMVIHGRSAGGLTVLSALCNSDAFAAGTSHYGVTDLASLATDTHKFESRYLDRLVGPWPVAETIYRERSPVHQAERITSPVLLLAGGQDRVVPVAQAEVMIRALQAKGVPCGLIVFDGEGHGFRQSETIERAAEAELWFYGQVLGFEPADDIVPPEFDPPLPARGG
ncbi:MAG: alpha/beta hydrolase family protein, partial [Pseudonocardiaceae bacterium]